jgi:hypothetical protein
MITNTTRWTAAAAISVALVAICAFLAARFNGDLRFVVAPGVCVVVLCVFGERFFPATMSAKGSLLVLRGIGRGGLVGLGAWFAMMYLVPIFQQVGGKFPLYVACFAPFAFGLGAVVGGLARLLSTRFRRSQV